MLDEGLPYRVLIDELAETGGGITPQSLCAWLHSGYQDYLKNRQTIDVAKSEAEFAADLLRELGKMDAGVVQRACLTLANLQILKAMLDHGDEALRKMLHVKPASYLAMLNTVCHLAQAKLAQDKSPKVA